MAGVTAYPMAHWSWEAALTPRDATIGFLEEGKNRVGGLELTLRHVVCCLVLPFFFSFFLVLPLSLFFCLSSLLCES